jgi:hypothetical protein
MNVTDAAYDTVHQYKGGSVALAPRMGLSDAVLRAKVNPNTDRNRLALEEADELMGKSGDYRILHALAASHGFVAIKVDEPEAGSLTSAMFEASKAKGGLAGLVLEAMADGRITPNEAGDVARKVMDAVQALTAVAQHARAEAGRGQPA